MHPQHFGTDPTEIRIRIPINPKIWIQIPDQFWLKFWHWQVCALWVLLFTNVFIVIAANH